MGGAPSFWTHQRLPDAGAFADTVGALALVVEIVRAQVSAGLLSSRDGADPGLCLDSFLELGGTFEVALDFAPDAPSIFDLGDEYQRHKRHSFFAQRAERCLGRLGTEGTIAALERALPDGRDTAPSDEVASLHYLRDLLTTLAQDAAGSDEEKVQRALRLLVLARTIDTSHSSFLTEDTLDVFPPPDSWRGAFRWILFRTVVGSGDDEAPLTFLRRCEPEGAEVLLRETAAALRSGDLVLPRRLTERLPALFVGPGRGTARVHPFVGDRVLAVLALTSIAWQEGDKEAARRVFRFVRDKWWERWHGSLYFYLRALDQQCPIIVDWVARRWGTAPFKGLMRELKIRARITLSKK
jgi:hypothetical protein